jgi:hypothetical protein
VRPRRPAHPPDRRRMAEQITDSFDELRRLVHQQAGPAVEH